MNLIRLIKLKKINGELNNLTDVENQFLSLCDGLKLQAINTNVNDKLYGADKYINRDGWTLIVYQSKYKKMWFSYDFYAYLGVFYNYDDNSIDYFLMRMINSKLGLKNIIISNEFN